MGRYSFVFYVSHGGNIGFPYAKRTFSMGETYVFRKENIKNDKEFCS